MSLPQIQSQHDTSVRHHSSAPQLNVSDEEKQQADQAAKVQVAADSLLDTDHARIEASVDKDINATTLDVSEDDEPELDEDQKKAKELEAEKAKMKKQQWINFAAAVGVVALGAIGVFAFSFSIAALVAGTSALELTVSVIVGGAAFAGAGLTLYFALIRPGWEEKIKILDENDK